MASLGYEVVVGQTKYKAKYKLPVSATEMASWSNICKGSPRRGTDDFTAVWHAGTSAAQCNSRRQIN